MNPVTRGLTLAVVVLVLAVAGVTFLASTLEDAATQGHEVDHGTLLP